MVEVGGERAHIAMPLGRAVSGTWHWYAAHTPDNLLEFEWALRIEADTAAYHVGFKLFKSPAARPRSGTLADLVGDGQIDIAHETVRNGRRTVAVPRYPLAGRIEDAAFVFEIVDSAALHAVFSGRPRSGTVLRYLGRKRSPLADAPISYASAPRAGR
jgi:hypothetical protein